MKNIILIIFTISFFVSFGQKYKYEANISDIDEDGFIKVLLPNDVTAKLNSNFSDVRIYDTTNVEIPYIFEKEIPISEKEFFEEYDIIEKEHYKRRRYTRIVIHNSKKTKINNIALRIKNADVRKKLKLNASYDNKTWYVLKDNYYYNSINNNSETSEIRVLDFPLSDYEYYELLIDDFYDKPINIIKAGFYNMRKENGKYSKVNNTTYSISDTLKETTIKIATNNNYIDKITFKINNPKYYVREASIYVKEKENLGKRKKVKIYENRIANINLISNSSNSFNINNLLADTIFVKIRNNDNQSLQINDVELYQLNKYLISELSSTNSYHIKFSDKNVSKPVYDLEYFTDKIPENLKVAKVSEIKQISETKKSKSNNINFSSYWLWLSVIGITILLGYMSYSMIKEKTE